ncbi:unnamed protein product [Stenotrophomonas maltophilia]|nr:unnamed protein product [Stenotrophomonas maltophilia]
MILEAWSEGLSDQSLLPALSQRGVVAVTPPNDNPSELRGHEKGVIHNLRIDVVAIQKNRDA